MIDQLATALKQTPEEMRSSHSATDVRAGAGMPPLATTPANENALGDDDPAVRLAAEALAREQARRERAQRRAAKRRRWLILLLSMLVTLVALKLFAQEVVRLVPGAAHLYRSAGMRVAFDAWRVEGVRVRWVPTASGDLELSITGRIRNRSGQALPMPMVSLQLLNADGDPVYAWGIPPRDAAPIASGATARFHTRIAHVPRAALGLRVRVHAAPDAQGKR